MAWWFLEINIFLGYNHQCMPEKKRPANGGGGDEKKAAPALTPQNMSDWNRFLDFVKQKGYEGSKELDTNEPLAKSLFDQYRKVNPNTTISYDIVPAVQMEMQKLRNNAQAFAQRRGAKDASNIMSGVSKVDGFFGSRTSQFRFPEMVQNNFHNNALKSTTNLGLVDGNITPVGNPVNALRRMPKGVQPWKSNDGKLYYTDPQTGDAVPYQ
jgi:hypothetical protein